MKKRVWLWLAILVIAGIGWMAAVPLAVSLLRSSLTGPDYESVHLSTGITTLVPGARRAALPVLLDSLRSTDRHVRANAWNALGLLRFRSQELIPTLVSLLKDGDEGVRLSACSDLGELGPDAEPAVAALITVVQDEGAGRILNDGSGPARRVLAHDSSKKLSVRSAAAEALGKIGPKARAAVPALMEAAQDANPFVRFDTAIALWKIEGEAIRSVPILSSLLSVRPAGPRDPSVASMAAHALGDIGAETEPAVPALIALLARGRREGGDEAAESLGKLGAAARTAEPKLLELLSVEILGGDDSYHVITLATALAQIGCRSPEAIWALLDVVKDREYCPTQEAAMRVLPLFGPNVDGIDVALIEATTDAEPRVSELASNILASYAPVTSQDPLATLNATLKSKDIRVRVVSAEALWKLTGKADLSIPVLIDALTSRDVLVRRWAAHALGVAKSEHAPAVVPGLSARLRDEDLVVRVYAAEGLWTIEQKDEPAIRVLVDVLENHDNPDRARKRAAYALGRMGGAAKSAEPVLRAAISDESHWNVCVAAGQALERLFPEETKVAAEPEGLPRVQAAYPPR